MIASIPPHLSNYGNFAIRFQRSFHSTSPNTPSLTAHAARTAPSNLLISLYCHSNPSWAPRKTGARQAASPPASQTSQSYKLFNRLPLHSQLEKAGIGGKAGLWPQRLPLQSTIGNTETKVEYSSTNQEGPARNSVQLRIAIAGISQFGRPVEHLLDIAVLS